MNSPKKLVMPEMPNMLMFTKALFVLLTKPNQAQPSGLEAKGDNVTWTHIAKLSYLQNQIGCALAPQC